mmetsp:Transcript_12825/g.19882  ORF Transcript_12825/g.19882 Transcript_12825/m.19882 type:complete len:872 (-) Transcript_12825:391-3006(-)
MSSPNQKEEVPQEEDDHDTTTKTNILIEILSCWNLLKGDLRTSDPYVKIKMGSEDLHETKHMVKTLDPVFTIKHDSLYCLQVSPSHLEQSQGLTFKVKDWDPLGSNDTLGHVHVPPHIILEASGERLEFPLQHPKKHNKPAGHIAIRCRPVTVEDTQLLQQTTSSSDDDHHKKKKNTLSSLFHKKDDDATTSRTKSSGLFTKNQKIDKATGETVYRLRPTRDPQRRPPEDDTEWFTQTQLDEETHKPSRKWIDMGSGTLAKVYVEILKCVKLPDKDGGLSKKNKTDAFCAVLYEDSFRKTTVIDDCCSPQWMPWMDRAFVFRMQHPSSHVHVCVLDHDTGPLAKHDVIGKISIHVGQLVPNTLYNLEYPLYESSKVTTTTAFEEGGGPRRDSSSSSSSQGTIHVRLRVEYMNDARSTLFKTSSLLLPPPSITVNVDNKADYRMVRKALQGKHDTRKYSMDTLKSHVQELKSYTELQLYIMDAITNVLFWKGNQFPLPRISARSSSSSSSISLPVHSVTLWIMGMWIVEHPSYLPTVMWWSMTWFMMAMQFYRTRNRPHPWWSRHGHSLGDFLKMLMVGTTSSNTIHAPTTQESQDAVDQFQTAWSTRVKESKKRAEERAAEALQEQEEYEALMAEMDIQDPVTENGPHETLKSGGFSLLKPVLYPVQQNLARVCDALRIVRNIILWEESYYAFWITLGSFIMGVVFLMVPWIFLMRWTCRFIVYILLGPWMYAVDKYYLQPLQQQSVEDQKKHEQEELHTKIEAAQEHEKEAREKREEALHQKDMKAMLYGNYETSMPILQTDLYYDIPVLATSSAVPLPPTTTTTDDSTTKSRGGGSSSSSSEEVIIERIGGQTLPSSFTTKSVTDKKEE